MECSSLVQCPFFNDKMANMPHLANLIKDKYCRGKFVECARFRVSKAKGKEKVPGDLFPQDASRADAIINNP